MGEEGEMKEEVPKEEERKEEPPEIVLKVYMHCEACAKKVEKSIRRIEGVEEVKTDSSAQLVVVKAKTSDLDPMTICERVQKKTGRKIELISPLPKPPEEEEKKEEPKEEEKQEEPSPVTVVLKVRMHCEACAQVLQKKIKKIEGVESVLTDLPNELVTVKGFIDQEKLVENVYRRTRKQASVVKEDDKVEEETKPEEVKEGGDEGEENKEEEGNGEEGGDIKKSEYWPTKYYTDYVYVPEIFSDENPNACCVM